MHLINNTWFSLCVGISGGSLRINCFWMLIHNFVPKGKTAFNAKAMRILCFHVLCLNACVRYHVFAKKVHCQTTCRGMRCFQSCTLVKGIGIVKSYGKGNMWHSCYTSSDQQLYEQHSAQPQYEKMQVPWSTIKGWTMNWGEDSALRTGHQWGKYIQLFSSYKNVQTVTQNWPLWPTMT